MNQILRLSCCVFSIRHDGIPLVNLQIKHVFLKLTPGKESKIWKSWLEVAPLSLNFLKTLFYHGLSLTKPKFLFEQQP